MYQLTGSCFLEWLYTWTQWDRPWPVLWRLYTLTTVRLESMGNQSAKLTNDLLVCRSLQCRPQRGKKHPHPLLALTFFIFGCIAFRLQARYLCFRSGQGRG